MNLIFKYNSNAKYSTKDLKGGHNTNDFLLLDIYLNEKRPSVKIWLLNISKNHHIIGKSSPIVVGYDECLLSNAICMKFYNSHGKYEPVLNEYFNMY